MEEIKIILTIRECECEVDNAKGEIQAEAYVGRARFGKIYPFGGDQPSFDQMFQMVTKFTRDFLHKHGFPHPDPAAADWQSAIEN